MFGAELQMMTSTVIHNEKFAVSLPACSRALWGQQSVRETP